MAPFNSVHTSMRGPRALLSRLLLLAAVALTAVQGRLEVAKTLGSHMVLQRAPHRAAIYGHADPFARVAVAVRRDQVRACG
jgi:hypothetical protein